MIAAPVEDHVRRKRWREHTERVEGARRKHENRVRGMDLVLRLESGRQVEFRKRPETRGRRYDVPPIPWHVALEILAIQDRWNAALEDPRDPDWPAIYAEIARLFKLVCRPVSKIGRLLWPLTPSPLKNAPHVFHVRALGFFWMFRRLDSGESTSRILEGQRPGTSPSSSSGSPRISPSAAMNGGAP